MVCNFCRSISGLNGFFPVMKYIRAVFAIEVFEHRLMKHHGSDIAPVNIDGLLR